MRLVQLLKLNIFHFDFSGNTELRRVVLSMTGATYHTIHPGKTGSVQSRVSPACCSPQLIGSVPGSGSRDSVISGLLGQVQRRDWGPTSGSSLYHCYLATCSHSGHRRTWVIFRWGPTILSCQNSILSCQNFFMSGGGRFSNSVMPSCCSKLLCQTVLPMSKNCS